MAAMDILETVRPTVTCSRTRQSDRRTDRHYFNHIFACLFTSVAKWIGHRPLPVRHTHSEWCDSVLCSSPSDHLSSTAFVWMSLPPPIRSNPFPELSSSPVNTQVSAALITASKDSSGQPRCLQCCNEEIGGGGNNSEAKKKFKCL